jgi:hypothetical protein
MVLRASERKLLLDGTNCSATGGDGSNLAQGRCILVLFPLLFWGQYFLHWRWDRIGKSAQVLLQFLVAFANSSLVGVIHLEFLLQHEDQFWAPAALQAFGNLGAAGLNPRSCAVPVFFRREWASSISEMPSIPNWFLVLPLGMILQQQSFYFILSQNHNQPFSKKERN